jgi:hypothetical protein
LCWGNHDGIGNGSMANSTWVTLNDLGRNFGISPFHCGRALEHEGWRDRQGHPTDAALEAGAVNQHNAHIPGRSVLWNADLCTDLLERCGYRPVTRSEHIGQWTDLLEAMTAGSPSITTTADQMAEELPPDLVEDVNRQLSRRGCRYQVCRPLSNRH